MVAWSSAAAAQAKLVDPKPRAIDISPFKDQLRVFQDQRGGTYVVLGEALGAKETRVWYGTGKALYEQLQPRRSRNGERWSIALWAPRIPDFQPARVDRTEDGRYEASCGNDPAVALVELTGDKAAAALGATTLYTTATIRQAHMLARDDNGVYYYVDRLRDVYGGKGYRVLVGRKGGLKQLPLVDVATDYQGEVFSTKSGNLRLIHHEDPDKPVQSRWIKGKKTVDLLSLDVVEASRMIYRDLGIYKSIGTFCDNL